MNDHHQPGESFDEDFNTGFDSTEQRLTLRFKFHIDAKVTLIRANMMKIQFNAVVTNISSDGANPARSLGKRTSAF